MADNIVFLKNIISEHARLLQIPYISIRVHKGLVWAKLVNLDIIKCFQRVRMPVS